MELEPLRQWICDSCGEIIESPKQAYFEWYLDGHGNEMGFRIVHYKPQNVEQRCQYNDRRLGSTKCVMGLHLPRVLGSDGLVILLSILERGRVKNPGELTEMIRRLHVPYYEETRQYWSEAEEEQFLDGTHESARYSQDFLTHLINEYRD